jgi:hypothetical protein
VSFVTHAYQDKFRVVVPGNWMQRRLCNTACCRRIPKFHTRFPRTANVMVSMVATRIHMYVGLCSCACMYACICMHVCMYVCTADMMLGANNGSTLLFSILYVWMWTYVSAYIKYMYACIYA